MGKKQEIKDIKKPKQKIYLSFNKRLIILISLFIMLVVGSTVCHIFF